MPALPAQLPASRSWVLVFSRGEALPSRCALCSPALQMWFLQLQEPSLGSHLQVAPGKLRQKFTLGDPGPSGFPSPVWFLGGSWCDSIAPKGQIRWG